jgi:maleylacetoacetate isomerase
VLELPSGELLTESLAIIDYLDHTHPSVPLIPKSPLERARVWAMSEIINAGTQPIQNMNVFLFHSSDPAEQKRWNQHFIYEGLKVYEAHARNHAGEFSFGNSLTLADLCLAPQVYNAERFGVDLHEFPTIQRIMLKIAQHPSYIASHPDQFQP